MAKYQFANAQSLVTLKYQREQVAFLRALALRFCPACACEWSIEWGDIKSTFCPKCQTHGRRQFDKMVLLAGRQGGKTRVGTLAGVLEASMPNSYGWVTAPTYRDLADFVEPAFFAQLPQHWLDEGNWSVGDRILDLPNGARVAFRSLEDPQIVRGPTLDWWLMDEGCKVSKVAHEVGGAMLAIKQGVEIITTTPRGEDWVWEEMWCRAEAGTPGYWAAKWVSSDNPTMSKEYIESQRATMSAEMFAQEYLADIVTFQGAIYGGDLIGRAEIDDKTTEGYEKLKTLIPEWPSINPARTAVIGLDPGSDHPFAGVLLLVTEKGLIVCGEYEEREKPAATHASGLKALAAGLSPRWGCDRSQAQMMIELAQHGIFAVPAENAVIAGIERVKSWIIAGQLFIVKSRCPKLLSSLRSYRWAETDKKDGSTGIQAPYKRKDDLPDALRYAVMTWPHLPTAPEVDQSVRDLSKVRDSDRHDIERMLRHERAVKDKEPEGIGDFYGVDDDPVAGSYDAFYA